MSERYLAFSDVAKRLGLSEGTLRSYSTKKMLPEPDAYTGTGVRAVRGWLPETIDTWNQSRPGRGKRGDS